MKDNNNPADDLTKKGKELKTCTVIDGSGNIKFDGNISINGKFYGNIIAYGILRIEASAVVTGGIVADCFYLSGSYSGYAIVKNKSFFKKNSYFSGHLISRDTEFEEGCKFRGRHSLYTDLKGDKATTMKETENVDDDN